MSVIFCMPPTKQNVIHKWRTGLQRSINGVEKRSALYTWFRVNMECSYITGVNSESNYIRNRLKRDITDTFYIPVFPDRTTLTSTAASGTDVLQCAETDYRHFYEDRDAVIVNPSDWTDCERVTIDTISGTNLTLSDTIGADWTSGSYVYPLYGCRINSAQEVTKQFQYVDTFDIDFSEMYEIDRAFVPADVTWSGTSYSGIDVFIHAPIKEFEQTFNHPYDLTQWIGKGLAYTWYGTGQTEMGEKNSYIFGDNRPEQSRYYIKDVLDFFDYKKGRWGTFLTPTWNKDIVITTTFSGSQTTLFIDDNEYYDYYYGEEIMGKYIIIWLSRDDFVIRKVIWAEATYMVLDQGIGTDVFTQAEVDQLYVSFLVYSRFDQDDIEFQYINEDIARVALNFAGLVEEIP